MKSNCVHNSSVDYHENVRMIMATVKYFFFQKVKLKYEYDGGEKVFFHYLNNFL